MYFTSDTDEAIIRFLNTPERAIQHEIFEKEIKPVFEKLIESLVFVYGFFNIDDVETLKRECLSHLYEILPKYNHEKAKAFSYFNVVAKNWFMMKMREANKRNKLESELYYDLDHEVVKNDPNFIVSPHEEVIEDAEKWIAFYKEIDSWRDKLDKKTERQVLEAVIFIMKNPDLVTIYNKKAVYLYLRELTGLNVKQVILNLKKIKILYDEWHERYFSTGE